MRPLVSSIVVGLSLYACGGGRATGGDETFRAIQRHEQSIALGQSALEREHECEAARSITEARICSESQALCTRVSDLEDTDAHARCMHADAACRSAREQSASLCATKPTEHER